MSTLHVALLPYPSPQGTQGALTAMIRALRSAGEDASLLVHPHGDGRPSPVPVRRTPRAPFGQSLRSGPTVGRALLDALALPAVAFHGHRAEAVFAHSVEAAFACRLTGVPYVYVAHTMMERELPFYAKGEQPRLAQAGRVLDTFSAGRPGTVLAAVSPALVTQLEQRFERPAHYLPVPWTRAAARPETERTTARARLGATPATFVLGYTGNLDRYQGVEHLVPTLARLRAQRDARLVVATESDPSALDAEARRAGVRDAIFFFPLTGEKNRIEAHAPLDATLVPRTCEGGIPMKLLDSLARGVPGVASLEATAGLPFGEAVRVVPADPANFADACTQLAGVHVRSVVERACFSYIDTHHAQSAFMRGHTHLRALLVRPGSQRGGAL